MRKRLLFCVVGVVCVVVLVLAMLLPRLGVTKANFDRIENGMAMERVIQILGGPPLGRTGLPGIEAWAGDDGAGIMLVLQDGIVVHKLWQNPNSISFSDKIRRWLGLEKNVALPVPPPPTFE